MGRAGEGQVRIWVVSLLKNDTLRPMSMKTCSLHESEAVDPKNLAVLLGFIPVFEDPAFCPGRTIPLDEDELPDIDFMKVVSRFMDACYKNGFVVRFDWETWESQGQGFVQSPGSLTGADMAVLRRLLTWHIRQNRFTKNHVATMIASGHILAILKCLRALAV